MSNKRMGSCPVLIRLALCLAVGLALLETSHAQECPDQPDTSGSHSFRRIGETIEIPITLAGCQPVALDVHWSNGRNNGGLFNLTFLDGNDHTLYTKQISAFLSGRFEFPLEPVQTLSASGVVSLMAVPTLVTVQAAPPFGLPATLFYRVERLKLRPRPERKANVDSSKSGVSSNHDREERHGVVSMRHAVRIIGVTRRELVLIKMTTNNPFPVKDSALQLRVGERVFVEELSGDFTGRELILTLTPAMFDELKDGADIVAFFEGGDLSWHFGKLDKGMLEKTR